MTHTTLGRQNHGTDQHTRNPGTLPFESLSVSSQLHGKSDTCAGKGKARKHIGCFRALYRILNNIVLLIYRRKMQYQSHQLAQGRPCVYCAPHQPGGSTTEGVEWLYKKLQLHQKISRVTGAISHPVQVSCLSLEGRVALCKVTDHCNQHLYYQKRGKAD